MTAERTLILDLLADYGALLDHGNYAAWLGLFAPECTYNVVPRENYDRGLPVGLIYCDSRAMLEDRIMALREANKYNIHTDRHLIGLPRLVPAGSGPTGSRSRRPLRFTRPIKRVQPGCSRPASTRTGWSVPVLPSRSVTSSSCSTPSRSQLCSPPHFSPPQIRASAPNSVAARPASCLLVEGAR